MKTLIIYYSRSGVTKTVAEKIAPLLNADTEELIDTKDRSGVIGYAVACKDALGKKAFPTEPLKSKLSEYDLIIIGTPVWASTMSTATRFFLQSFGKDIAQAAVFCTTGRTGIDKTNSQSADLIAGNVIASAGFVQKFVKKNNIDDDVVFFVDQIKENYRPLPENLR